MKIKLATEKDAKRISYLIHKSTDANPNQYTKKQIAAWKKYTTPSKIKRQINDRLIFCAFKNNKLIGTVALQGNFVVGFYVGYSIRKSGIGTKLLNHLEEYAKQNKIKKLYLTSTPSAFEFYKKRGFTAKRKVIIEIFGVDYEEVEMEKVL